MKKYIYKDMAEKELEDLIRQAPELIEEGLTYLDHQKLTTRGPLDVLLADSGGALIVAELKVEEDDGMLFQGIDYYDFVNTNKETYARLYKKYKIDPRQSVRLFLIAPSFSIATLNRLKWINLPISLFTFQCILLDGEKNITPVYSEVTIPSTPVEIEEHTIDDRLNYITDTKVKKMLVELLDEIRSWDVNNISIDAIKYELSLKYKGTLISYIGPRRKHFIVYTNSREGDWTGYPIYTKGDIPKIIELLKLNIESKA